VPLVSRLRPGIRATGPNGSTALPFAIRERNRISYLTALTSATYVVLPKENHMQLIEAATLDEIRRSRGICSFTQPSRQSSRNPN
jgi:hypothetical protein